MSAIFQMLRWVVGRHGCRCGEYVLCELFWDLMASASGFLSQEFYGCLQVLLGMDGRRHGQYSFMYSAMSDRLWP
jgi:hypothetical protein